MKYKLMMRPVLWIVAVFVALQPFGAVAQGIFGPSNSQTIRKGNHDYAKGNFDAAGNKYRDVLKNNSDNPTANFNLATTYYKKGDMDSALTYFNAAMNTLKDDKLRSKAHYNAGNAYLHKKDYTKAIDSYKQSLKLDPNDENARYNLSYAQRMMQQQMQQQQQQPEQGEEGDDEEGKKKQENGDQKMNNNEPKKSDSEMTKEKADQILNALNNREQDIQKDLNQQQPQSNSKEKDW